MSARSTRTLPLAMSTSLRWSPRTSPRRSPPPAASTADNRYFSGRARTSSSTSASVGTRRSGALSVPAPFTLHGLTARRPVLDDGVEDGSEETVRRFSGGGVVPTARFRSKAGRPCCTCRTLGGENTEGMPATLDEVQRLTFVLPATADVPELTALAHPEKLRTDRRGSLPSQRLAPPPASVACGVSSTLVAQPPRAAG